MHGARRSVRPGAKVQRRSGSSFGARRDLPPMRRKRRRPNRLKRWTLRHPWLYRGIRFSLLASIWGAIVLGLAVIYFIASVPDPVIAALDDRPPNVTVLAEDGTVLAERGLRRGHVRLDVLPPYLVQAVLATEDRRFYSHFGIDPLGLVRATFTQRLGRHRGRRRLDHHPAARQESVPEARPHRHPQARRGGLCGVARAALLQAGDPRALSQSRLFRRRHLRGRGRLAPLFRQVVALRHAAPGGAAGRAAQGAVALLAAPQRQARQRPGGRGAGEHGAGRLPVGGAGPGRERATAQAVGQRRRYRLSLSGRLGGRASSRAGRRA